MADHIQIGDVAPRASHAGDGVTTTYAFPFPIFNDADLEVYIDGAGQTLSADYTMAGAGQTAGGTVTFTQPPANDAEILFVRRLTIARTSDFQASGEFRAKVINDELDFQTAILQQINDDLGRTVRLETTDASASLELPGVADRASALLAFDASGDVTAQALSELSEAAVISNATPAAATPSGSAGISSELSAADHSHPLPTLSDIGIASQVEAEAGTDNTKAMTPLRTAQSIAQLFAGTDQLARDMAASAMAYAMATNDANSVTGSIGAFWFSDDFKSDSLTTKTNATYDAGGDYYHNRGIANIIPTGVDWTMRGSGETYGSGSVSSTSAGSSYTTNAVLSGDFTFEFALSGSLLSDHTILGLFDAAEVSTAASGGSYQRAGMEVMTNSFWFKSGNSGPAYPEFYMGAAKLATLSEWANTSDTYQYRRTAGVIDLYNVTDDAVIYTWAGTYTQDMHALVGGGYTQTTHSIEFITTAPASNMVLAPSALTIDAADPSDVLGYFVLEPVDSVTFGTDVVGKVSIDGGTTKATGTWTKVGDIGPDGKELWRLEADVSGQSGSSLTYEITTANNKEIRLHDCVGLIGIY